MKKIFIITFFFLTVIALLTISTLSEAKDKPILLKFNLYTPPGHIYSKACKKILPMIEKSTNGRVKVKLFTSGALGKLGDMYSLIQNGVVDLAVGTSSILGKSIPFCLIDVVPFVWKDSKATNEAWDNGLRRLVEEEIASKGYDKVHIFGTYTAGMRYFGTKKKEIKKLDDFKGMKIRTFMKYEAKFVQAGGGSAIYVPIAEVYEALERNIIDGLCGNLSIFKDWKHMEPCDYLFNCPIDQTTMQLLVNADSLNKLPGNCRPEVEKILTKLVAELRRSVITNEVYALDTVLPKHMKFYTPSAQEKEAWKRSAKVLLDEWKREAGPKGTEALGIIEKYNN